ncbi:MAG: transposase [Candidatus Kerfeldbacteria bacterium]|nr:transposase [Candidatus Kerfeldbacteria bacterium]
MPKKLVVREFEENGFYHIFNRGNNKQKIFRDSRDFDYFLGLLQEYTTPPKNNEHINFYGTIETVCYCLMSNHFHLIVHQLPEKAISQFMHVISIKYTKYFNKKYTHLGHVFQGAFLARRIKNYGDLLNTSKYVHKNAEDICNDILKYQYSSAAVYIGKRKKPEWLHTKDVFDVLRGGFGVQKNKLFSSYKKYLLLN